MRGSSSTIPSSSIAAASSSVTDGPALQRTLLNALFWVASARFAGQLLSWLITIWVIRLLSPHDYALMATAGVFLGACGLVEELGLGLMITRTKDVDETSLRKAFGIVLTIKLALFAAVILGAPLIGALYASADLVSLLRLLAFNFLLSAFTVLPRALLEREMAFRKLMTAEFAATLIAAATTLVLALRGDGVWALAVGALSLTIVRTAILNVVRPFARLPIFSTNGMGEFLSFGGVVSLERFVWYLYSQADVVIASALLGSEALGLYVVGKHIASLPAQKISPIIQEVVFPAFARIQADSQRVGRSVLQGANALTVMACPVLFGMAALAPDLIRIALGERWVPAALPLQTYCVIVPLGMVSSIILSALKAIGRSDLSLQNVATTSVLMIVAFLVGSAWGLVGISLAWLFVYPICFLLAVARSAHALGTTPRALFARISGSLFSGVLMIGVVTAVGVGTEHMLPNALVHLLGLVLVGALVYSAVMLAFGRPTLVEAANLLRRRRASV